MDNHHAPDAPVPAASMEPPDSAPKAAVLYLRLSAMMFLQFAVWGAWAVMIAGHMTDLNFTGKQISYVFGTTAFGALISPLIAGWVADRYMPSQIFTAISHLLGAVLLFIAWKQTEFGPLWTAIFLYAVLYMPTIALTNTIAFYHMGDSEKFGNIRVWGTLGWIAVQTLLAGYLRFWERRTPGVPHAGDCLIIAAICAVIMGLYSFTLPNTPPTKEAKNPYAFLEALKLARSRNFAVLLVISFLVAIELPFYYNLTLIFLTDKAAGVGLPQSTAQLAMTIGQWGEVLLMVALWPMIRLGGMRTTIFLGILAWPIRYAIFAIGHPTWLVIAAQSLHGICYSFFFVGGMIAVERLSHKDIRASAQGLIVFATSGVGMLIGHFASGRIHDYFAFSGGGFLRSPLFAGLVNRVDLPSGGWYWPGIFMVPIVITVLAAIAFFLLFDERAYQEESARIAAEDRGELPAASVG